MYWGINTFSSPHQGVVFLIDAEGQKEGKAIKVRIIAEHNDAFAFTSIPIVACLKQYLDGIINKPGLWMMGNVVEPTRLMTDMENMGIKIKTHLNGK